MRLEQAGIPVREDLSWKDAAGWLAALTVLMTLSYFRSRHRIFWGDEIVGWTLLRESSFARLYQSWLAGADSSGLWYYVLLRPWISVFGATEVAARAFTTAGVWCSLVLVWIAARRFYSFGVVAFCVPFAYLASPMVVLQLSNARTYGLYLAAVAAVVLMFAKTGPGAQLTPGLLLGTALAHALLIGSHVLGLIFSGFFLAGMVAQDRWAGHLRWRLYLAAGAGWLVLLATWRNLKATIDVGKPYFWTEPPHLRDLPLGMLGSGTLTPGICLGLALILAALAVGRGTSTKAGAREGAPRTPVYFVLGTMATIALFLFVKSFMGNSVFNARYLIPMVIAGALLFCELTARLLQEVGHSRWEWMQAAAAVLLLAALVRHADPFQRAGEDYTADLVQRLPAGVPAVITDVNVFAEVSHYQAARVRLETEIDWPFTLSTRTLPRDVTSANMLAIWQRLGYFPGQILPADQVLGQPEFAVVSRESFPLWFEERIAADPQFQVADLGRVGGPEQALHLWLVHRRR